MKITAVVADLSDESQTTFATEPALTPEIFREIESDVEGAVAARVDLVPVRGINYLRITWTPEMAPSGVAPDKYVVVEIQHIANVAYERLAQDFRRQFAQNVARAVELGLPVAESGPLKYPLPMRITGVDKNESRPTRYFFKTEPPMDEETLEVLDKMLREKFALDYTTSLWEGGFSITPAIEAGQLGPLNEAVGAASEKARLQRYRNDSAIEEFASEARVPLVG